MLFNTASFACFFLVFFVIYRLLPWTKDQKLLLILFASLYFYAGWDYRFIPLLVGTGYLDFTIAKFIDRPGTSDRRRKLLVTASVTMNLFVLGVFKYANFFMANIAHALHLVGIKASLPVLHLVLPVGISFYTFQSISYVVDVYRRRFEARTRVLEFMSSLTFFPHLVAGPIIRSSHLLPQFENLAPIPWKNIRRGFFLIGTGLMKKTVADLLSPIADRAFTAHGPLSAMSSWTGALAFTGQIYGDFSGYTDIAIGSAALLGFHIPDNFNLPYFATSPVDFWKRWHISLSSWLRDYLYISLGGNRNHRYRNLMLTMLLGGLWHGAGWTFIVWGFYHGALLVVTHLSVARFPALDRKLEESPVGNVAKVLFTFYLSIIGWILFRAEGMKSALNMLRSMHHPRVVSEISRATLTTLGLTVFAIVFCHGVDYVGHKREEAATRPRILWPATCLALAFAIAYGESGHAFTYFQF